MVQFTICVTLFVFVSWRCPVRSVGCASEQSNEELRVEMLRSMNEKSGEVVRYGSSVMELPAERTMNLHGPRGRL